MKGKRLALTADRVAVAACPPGEAQVRLWDAVQPGLVVRVYASGGKTFWLRYRVGRELRWYRIGDASAISLKDARDAAKVRLGEVAKGGDPAADRRAQKLRESRRLAAALDAYERSLQKRRVVKTTDVLRLLRRELLGPLGDVDLGSIDQAAVVKRINAIANDRPGTARDLRTRAGVFFGWCASEGLIPASPMAGYRQPRKTRAERLQEEEDQQNARALADNELAHWWRATEAEGWPFGTYLQTLLLTGQRRTETARMRWADLDLEAGVWTIPALETKSGRAHTVPLPPELLAILQNLPRPRRCPWVFPGRTGTPMAGWTKRMASVLQVTAAAGLAPWTMHDLRRTMRSGLTALGVDQDVAEMMLNHAIGDELRRIYDKFGYPEKRVEAARAWGRHVLDLVDRADDGAAAPGGHHDAT